MLPPTIIFLPAAVAMCSLLFHALLDDNQFQVLSVAPFNVTPPPLAVVLSGLATLPNSKFLSSTVTVVLLTVVVVPLTTKSPPTVTVPLVVIAAALTVPVNVGLALNTALPVPVEPDAPLPPLATGKIPVTPLVKLTFVIVLFEPLIVLLVNVCVASVPTTVVVASGKVITRSAVGSTTVNVVSCASAVAPSNIILASVIVRALMFGAVNVLLVNVCDPVSVATVLSIATVTAPEPL